LEFTVYRYNTPNVVDQEIYVAAYQGNGTIELADWSRPSQEIGKTQPIPGFDASEKNRGEAIRMTMDVTAALNAAFQARRQHLGFSFRKPHISTIDPADRLGYSGLNTVGNFRLKFEPIDLSKEPADLSISRKGTAPK
jgi:hypothetical protein